MHDRPAPLVSVVMPLRNAQQYLREAVDSILGQTFADFELLLIDDFSQDGSLTICRSYAASDNRVRLLPNKERGIIGALNLGIAHARGQLIARMDADDVCEPQRLGSQVQAFQSNPAIAVLGSAASLIDKHGDTIGKMHYPTAPSDIYDHLLQRSCIIHPSAMMRADVVRRVGGYRPAFFRCEDYDLWLRIAEPTNMVNLEEPLIRYRLHEDQVTWAGFEQRILSELAAVALAKQRRAGQPDTIDNRSTIGRGDLMKLGLSRREISKQILYRSLGAATDASRLGHDRAAQAALGLAFRQPPDPLGIWLRCAALAAKLLWQSRKDQSARD